MISAVIDDPTAIWTTSASTNPLLVALSAEEKAQVVSSWVRGFQTLMHVLTALIGANFLLALVFIKRHSLSRPDEEALKERGNDWIRHRKEKRERKRRHGKPADDEAIDLEERGKKDAE